MHKRKLSDGFARAYAKFRGSTAFLWSLALVVGVWLTWDSIPFLPHLAFLGVEQLNVFLSVEASLSVALLIIANEKADRIQKTQLESILVLIKSIQEFLRNERDFQLTEGRHNQRGSEESRSG